MVNFISGVLLVICLSPSAVEGYLSSLSHQRSIRPSVPSYMPLASPYSPRNFALSMALKAGGMADEQLRERITVYMSQRGNETSLPSSAPLLRYKPPASESFFAFLKPSGWYKDKADLEYKKDFDARIPREEYRHPLSYVELKRYGFEDLIEPILERGGPYEVGVWMGYDWKEAKEQVSHQSLLFYSSFSFPSSSLISSYYQFSFFRLIIKSSILVGPSLQANARGELGNGHQGLFDAWRSSRGQSRLCRIKSRSRPAQADGRREQSTSHGEREGKRANGSPGRRLCLFLTNAIEEGEDREAEAR